ncbi:uncharacterized protein TNCV_325961 [Trichonephila clavipes]|nr:uncharacterized protein TNCV_325961 [Trichonephila clavipes]
MNLTLRNPPVHHWYAAKIPGLTIQCRSSRAHQTALARFRSSNLHNMTFVQGVKSNGLGVDFPAPRRLKTTTDQFHWKIRFKQPVLVNMSSPILLHDGARTLVSVGSYQKIRELEYELLQPPTYSPDVILVPRSWLRMFRIVVNWKDCYRLGIVWCEGSLRIPSHQMNPSQSQSTRTTANLTDQDNNKSRTTVHAFTPVETDSIRLQSRSCVIQQVIFSSIMHQQSSTMNYERS